MGMFYERYTEICKARGYSPSAGAQISGINKSNVTLWKRKYDAGEDVRPRREVIEKICNALGCEQAWLLGLEGEDAQPELSTELSPAKKKLLEMVDGLSKAQMDKVLVMVETMTKVI